MKIENWLITRILGPKVEEFNSLTLKKSKFLNGSILTVNAKTFFGLVFDNKKHIETGL